MDAWNREVRGSSPRMRGAHMANMDQIVQNRIIPADAGSTGLKSYRLWTGWDHPRGCGEHGAMG